ncbi:MAG: alpha/beta fold hydrolase, partial [Deltaproteobacteria bacterium]|nr:alpha/beta fold hydrolase [Deltaproteobacteria bacterium]
MPAVTADPVTPAPPADPVTPLAPPGRPVRVPRASEGPWRLEYPFRSRFAPLPQGFMHYADEGSGPPLLMVHGNPTWSFMFRKVIAAFRDRFRCLAPDHLGMGLSERPAGGAPRDLAGRAEDLSRFIEKVAPGKPLRIVAHDWGGPVALAWAVRNPARVASVCLMNTGLRIPRGYRMPWRLRAFQGLGGAGSFLARDLGLFAKGLLKSGTVRPLSRPAAEGLAAPYSRRELRDGVAGVVR